MNIIIDALGNVLMFALPAILYFAGALFHFTMEHVRTKLHTKRRCRQILLNQRCTYRL